MSRCHNGWIPGFLAGMLVATAASAATVSVDAGTGKGQVSKTWNIRVEQRPDGKALFSGNELYWLANTGAPRLPWGVVTVLLPPDADAASVKCDVQGAKYGPLAGQWSVDPQSLRATRDKDGKEIILRPEGVNLVNGQDTAIYGANAFWPADQARVLGTGKMRKWSRIMNREICWTAGFRPMAHTRLAWTLG